MSVKYSIVFLCLLLAAVTRLYKLEETATFFWDPAYDLRQIQIIYQEKNITLIGPISEYGDKVYSSLTYYMLLPFARVGNFDLASTTYGAAVYGWFTVCMLVYLTHRFNRKMVVPVALLGAIWFPLLESSRWAWNPHLVLFWIVLGLIAFQFKKVPTLFLAGLAFGLSLHNHYLALVATSVFIGLNTILMLQAKQYKYVASLVAGYLIALLPFVLFDLTHPPGLFLTRILYFNQTTTDPSAHSVFLRIVNNFGLVLQHYTHSVFLSVPLVIALAGLAYHDWKNNRSHLFYLAPWLAQIGAVGFINAAYPHYFLPGLLFFITYLFLPRRIIGLVVAQLVFGFLIIASLFTVGAQVTTEKFASPNWQPNIKTVRAITDVIATKITENNLQGVNIAVLGSTDTNLYGWKYRSLLEIRGVPLMTKYEYFTNNYLFVVSQASETDLRQDAVPEMERFRTQKLVQMWSIPDSSWFVYLFSF